MAQRHKQPDLSSSHRTMSSGQLPTFIIIGAMKCGTSSLHEYLDRHPGICMSTPKEPSYFVHNRHKSLNWYKDRFRREVPVRGEASTHYTKYPIHEGVPERMHALLPGARLIYLIRSPVERFLSHYVHNYVAEGERRSVEEVLHPLQDQNPYLAYGKYFMQLKRYRNYYPRNQILLVKSSSLKDDKRETLSKVFEFVGAKPERYDFGPEIRKRDSDGLKAKTSIGSALLESKFVRQLVQQSPSGLISWLKKPFEYSAPQPSLSQRQRAKLREYYQQDVEDLREYSGLCLDDWEV